MNDVVGGCGIIERISEFASGFGVQMQEWLAPFDLPAETCPHVDASGLDVGRAGQLGEARQLAIIDMYDAPGGRGGEGMGSCGARRGGAAACGLTAHRMMGREACRERVCRCGWLCVGGPSQT